MHIPYERYGVQFRAALLGSLCSCSRKLRLETLGTLQAEVLRNYIEFLLVVKAEEQAWQNTCGHVRYTQRGLPI
jgi:hypothetical protein